MDNTVRFKLSLYLNYFVFAILLNSVGIVILKSIENFGVIETQASQLELFKDLPIAITSFLVASFLPRLGYRVSMLIGLALVGLGCIWMYSGNSFGSARVLFMMVGIAFALIKVSVYASIGLVTKDSKEHNALMSSIEGVFMFGIAIAYFLFPVFNDEGNPDAWLRVYVVLAVLVALSFIFLWTTKYDEGEIADNASLLENFAEMFALLAKVLVLVFVISAFLFVMIEQGIMTWLPEFNKRAMQMSSNIAIMMSSVLAISLGVGRLVAGYLSTKISWYIIIGFCLVMAMLMCIFVLPQTVGSAVYKINSFSQLPWIAFAFPLVGLFIAPIYPLLNSAVLSALPKKLHSSMSGLIIIFSALGGTLGSYIVGYLFKEVGAENAFFFTLIPMVGLLLAVIILKNLIHKQA